MAEIVILIVQFRLRVRVYTDFDRLWADDFFGLLLIVSIEFVLILIELFIFLNKLV